MTINYVIQVLSHCPPETRIPRAVQRRAVDSIANRLKKKFGPDIPLSRSHSRAGLALAWQECPGADRFGIDIEYCDSRRPIGEILSALSIPGPERFDVTRMYRLWAFGEAWFKTFQEWPQAAVAADVALTPLNQQIVTMANSPEVAVRYLDIDRFQACLVAAPAEALPAVDRSQDFTVGEKRGRY